MDLMGISGGQESGSLLSGPSSLKQYTSKRRPTVTDLGWNPDYNRLYQYDLVDSDGNDPYLLLREGFRATEERPARVFLDLPKYALSI